MSEQTTKSVGVVDAEPDLPLRALVAQCPASPVWENLSFRVSQNPAVIREGHPAT